MNTTQIAFNFAHAELWREIRKLEGVLYCNNIEMESIDGSDVERFANAALLLKQANEALNQYRINTE